METIKSTNTYASIGSVIVAFEVGQKKIAVYFFRFSKTWTRKINELSEVAIRSIYRIKVSPG